MAQEYYSIACGSTPNHIFIKSSFIQPYSIYASSNVFLAEHMSLLQSAWQRMGRWFTGRGKQAWRRHVSFSLAFCWLELCHMNKPNGKRSWESFSSFESRKKRNELIQCVLDKMRNISKRGNKITVYL